MKNDKYCEKHIENDPDRLKRKFGWESGDVKMVDSKKKPKNKKIDKDKKR